MILRIFEGDLFFLHTERIGQIKVLCKEFPDTYETVVLTVVEQVTSGCRDLVILSDQRDFRLSRSVTKSVNPSSRARDRDRHACSEQASGKTTYRSYM